jgi:hypothetical protein
METKFLSLFTFKCLRTSRCLFVLIGIMLFSSCFHISNQNPCECALNNIVVNTPSYNPETTEKCDKYESTLNENEREEWTKELQACTVNRQ